MSDAAPLPVMQGRLGALQISTWRVAVAVAVAHGLNDLYNAFLPPLLPRLMNQLDLSITLAATLTTVLALTASIPQPFMGAVADRYGARRFVIAGPVISAVFLSLIGFAGSFPSLLLLLALGGLGSAFFHPPAISLAAQVRHGPGAGARLSLFSFGGALGFALGPLIAVAVVGSFGLRGLAVTMLPTLLIVPLLLRVIPTAELPPVRRAAGLPSLRGPLGLLFAVSALGALVQRVFLTLQPIAIAASGISEAVGATILSTYLGAQVIGSLAGGLLADRFDRVHLLVALTVAAVPAHMLALALPPSGGGALVATAAAGLLNMALLPPLVLMAQESSPHGAATSAGVVMGLGWAAGSLGMIAAGALGDVIGARDAALLCMPVLLLAALVSLHPTLRPYRRARAHPRSTMGEGDATALLAASSPPA